MPRLLLLALLSSCSSASASLRDFGNGILVAQHRRAYDADSADKLRHGRASEFKFARFQHPAAVKSAFSECRPESNFKAFVGKDGRSGRVCSTQLGRDWVLAESEQVAPSCTCAQVLGAYLDGLLQRKWSADKVKDVKVSKHPWPKGGGEPHVRQDLVLHSQRVIRAHTGVMCYSQRITVDKVGSNYCAFVCLDQDAPATPKRPFNSLAVYVSLQQDGQDVRIYAAGIFEVNRAVVPNLVVFDASGIAGDMAGKGTLWLAGHFTERALLSRTRKHPDESIRQRVAQSLPWGRHSM